MSSLHARPRPRRHAAAHLHQRVQLVRVVIALSGAVLLIVATTLLTEPRFVGSLTFHNPTPYELSVEVTDSGHDGWMPVWIAARRTTTKAEQIYDIGETWVFRFSAQGRTSSDLRLTRTQLEGAGWHVRIPASIGDELRQLGAPPPP